MSPDGRPRCARSGSDTPGNLRTRREFTRFPCRLSGPALTLGSPEYQEVLRLRTYMDQGVIMLSTVGLTGALTLTVVSGRVLVMLIALRGTKPSERPAIIRALNEKVTRNTNPRTRQRAISKTKDA